MNTKVEKFAFGMALFFAFFLPALIILFPIAMIASGMAPDQAHRVINMTEPFIILFSGLFFPLMCVGCSIWIESAHFKALEKAEWELSDMTVSDMKTLPPNWKPTNTVFVCENVVIANDYFKSFLWVFRKLIGGRSRSFEKLIERGRREATVRVLHKAKESGTNVVWNIRYETSIVQFNNGGHEKAMAGVEIMAYGTAFLVDN